MPMRGLIKRDDPKLQASVHTPGAAGQLPDGACLRSFAVAGGAAAAHAHVRNEPIPRRLLSCGASSDAEAFYGSSTSTVHTLLDGFRLPHRRGHGWLRHAPYPVEFPPHH